MGNNPDRESLNPFSPVKDTSQYNESPEKSPIKGRDLDSINKKSSLETRNISSQKKASNANKDIISPQK